MGEGRVGLPSRWQSKTYLTKVEFGGRRGGVGGGLGGGGGRTSPKSISAAPSLALGMHSFSHASSALQISHCTLRVKERVGKRGDGEGGVDTFWAIQCGGQRKERNGGWVTRRGWATLFGRTMAPTLDFCSLEAMAIKTESAAVTGCEIDQKNSVVCLHRGKNGSVT